MARKSWTVTHGTEAGWGWHVRNGTQAEGVECGCKAARSAYEAKRAKAIRDKARKNKRELVLVWVPNGRGGMKGVWEYQ